MIGKKEIIIDADQFIKGMASSDYAPDGGIGTSSYGLNPYLTPGLIAATVTPTDISTNVAGVLIASCEDGQTVSAYDRLLVDSSANYYTLSGSTVTKRHTGVKTYTQGTTDMVSFAGNTYVTSTTDMALWNTSGSFTLTESWWVTTKSQTAFSSSNRHPLLVFENFLWVSDGANLFNITSSGTITASTWTPNSNELIVALGIDPYTGMMMVSVVTVQDYSAQTFAKYYVYLYDGYSSKPRRKIPVEDMVTAFYNKGGNVYCAYGQRLGQWNGNGITFLRKLNNVTQNGTDLAYKNHFTHLGNILHVADGADILSYGEVVGGAPAFFYTARNATGKSSMICNVGSNKLAMAASSKLYTVDYSSSSTGSGTLYTQNIDFPRPVYIRRMRVITNGIASTSGVGAVGIIDEKATTWRPTVHNFVCTTTTYVFDFDLDTKPIMIAQPFITFDTLPFSVIRIILYYDVAE